MIVSLHIATGALGGALVRSPIAAAALGPILHFYGDRVPHEDIDFEALRIGSGSPASLALRTRARAVRFRDGRGYRLGCARHRARGSASAARRAEALPQPPDPGLAPAGRPDR